MNSQTPILTVDTNYIAEVTATLRNLLRQVIKTREPEVLPIIDSPEAAATIPAHLVEHALQAIGIWLQLMNIAEENAAIRTRRTLEKQVDFKATLVSSVMSRKPRSIGPDDLAAEAVQLMEQYQISQMLVVDANNKLVGALNMHDLLRAKVI